MQTRFAGMTDTGLLREHNEDSLLLMPEYGIVAVADGMGGHRSGDVASQLAISTLSDFFQVVVGHDGTWPFPADPALSDEENYVVIGLRLANRRIFDRSLRTLADFGMGTTIVSAMFTRLADKVTVGHVGDSRCYRIRGAGDPPAHPRPLAHQRRAAHGAVDDRRGDEPAPAQRHHPRARHPGGRDRRHARREETALGDVYLLCSDGLSGLVTDEQIHEIITRAPSLDHACHDLIERANFFGGTDNITAVLVRIEEGDNPPAGRR